MLQSRHVLVIPIHGLHLKVAVVPGSTPFLLSNTSLRTLEAAIDTGNKVLSFPLLLTSKGLFLLDLNELAQQPRGNAQFSEFAETHQMVGEDLPCPRASEKKVIPAPNQSNQDRMFDNLRVGQPMISASVKVEQPPTTESSNL